MSEARTVEAWQVASLLRNDFALIHEWEFFYYHLELESHQVHKLKSEYLAGSIEQFSLLNKIINTWVVKNGQLATIEKLADILHRAKYFASKDELLKSFPNGTIVVINKLKNKYQSDQTLEEDAMNVDDSYSELQTKLEPSPVSILKVRDGQQEGQRITILTSYLLKMLSQIGDKPVAIISVNGRPRSGKSFLATQMIKYLKENGKEGWLDKEINSCFFYNDDLKLVTSGIQIWHEPFEIEFQGKSYAVIVMDTQGLLENTSLYKKTMIFNLSLILSSVFIYNEKYLNEDCLQHLHSFLNLAKFVVGGDIDGTEVANKQLICRRLIILLRDWQFQRRYACGYYDDNVCPPGQESNLKNDTFSKNSNVHCGAVKIREEIESCFESISLYAMSGPGNRFPDMYEYTNPSTWDLTFRDGIVDFIQRILSPSSIANSTKNMFGEEATGKSLMAYVLMWSEILQESEGIVESKTIFDATAELFFMEKINDCINEYKTKMELYLNENCRGVSDSIFSEFHKQLFHQVSSNFSTGNVFGEALMNSKYQQQLHERLNGMMEAYFARNVSNLLANMPVDNPNLQLTMLQAESRYNNARHALLFAQDRYKRVINSRETYTRQVVTKQRKRVLGITVSPSYSTMPEFDAVAYEAALCVAQAEVTTMEQRLLEAEQSLMMAQRLSIGFNTEKSLEGTKLNDAFKKINIASSDKVMATFHAANKANFDKETEGRRLETERALAREAELRREAEEAVRAHQAELDRDLSEKEKDERKYNKQMERLETSMPRPVIRQDNQVTIYQNQDGTIDVHIRGDFTWDQNFVNSLGGAKINNIQVG